MRLNEFLLVYRNLKRLLVGAIVLLSILFIVVLFVKSSTKFISESNIIFERYAILITFITIPLTLKIFHTKLKLIDKTDFTLFVSRYKKLYNIRLAILICLCLFNIISLYYVGTKNFIFMSIISIFALFLSAPQIEHADEKKDDDEISIEK